MTTEKDHSLALGPDVIRSPENVRESKATKVVIALLGAGLLFGPWAAYAAGARSQPVPGENRALAGRPQIDGFQTFNEITAYAADHFPLRDAAIRSNKTLIEDLFGEPPSYFGSSANPQVLVGDKDWLYFMDDFNEACSPKIPLKTVIAGVQHLNRMLTDSGRRLVLTVPPDKSTADPQYLPKSFELKQCSEIAKEQRWKAIRSMGVPGYVDMRDAVEKQEKEKGKLAFLPYDTHWNQDSEVTFAETVAGKLDPSLLQGTHVVAGQYYTEPGDLDRLNSQNHQFRFQAVYVMRDGVTVSPEQKTELSATKGAYTISHWTATTTDAPLFQPKTVLIGDSFSQRTLTGKKLQPFFRDLTRVPELTKAVLANTAEDPVVQKARTAMIKAIVDSDVTIVELVERTFAGVNGYGSLFDPKYHFLDDLQTALDAAPRK
jgi:alginate O-acetyltransferase complex protein AlgJ